MYEDRGCQNLCHVEMQMTKPNSNLGSNEIPQHQETCLWANDQVAQFSLSFLHILTWFRYCLGAHVILDDCLAFNLSCLLTTPAGIRHNDHTRQGSLL